MTSVIPGRCKLTKFVTNHVFRHKHLHMLTPVVDKECVTNKLWDNRASTSPGFDRFFNSSRVLTRNLDINLEFVEPCAFSAGMIGFHADGCAETLSGSPQRF